LSTPENQQAVDGDKQRDRLSTGSALFRLDLKESGYKVAWIEKPLQCLNYFLQPDFAPRAPSSRPCISCNKQPAGVREQAKLERRGAQSR
jgi:hypothetical protein